MVDAFLSRPQSRGPHPAVVVISGMGGLNWFQREMNRTFARAGFVAISPDLFDGYQAPDSASQLLAKNSLDVDQTVRNLAAATEYLRALPWVDTSAAVGVIGFCLGGGLAVAAHLVQTAMILLAGAVVQQVQNRIDQPPRCRVGRQAVIDPRPVGKPLAQARLGHQFQMA